MEAWQIALIVVFSILGALLLGTAIFFVVDKMRKRHEDQKIEEKVKTSAKELSDKFGGRENIVEIVQKGSRVIVTVKDPVSVDKDEISRSLDSVMFMSNKIVFVIGTKSEQFKALLEENVGKSK